LLCIYLGVKAQLKAELKDELKKELRAELKANTSSVYEILYMCDVSLYHNSIYTSMHHHMYMIHLPLGLALRVT